MSSQSNAGQDATMPIAIIGLSGRYPGDASTPENLWKLICEARSAMTEIPKDRFNVDAFYHPHNERAGAINVRGGHYMNHMPPDAFDAPFFSITPNEAKSIDPQQRMALECAFEAMENAGVRMEDLTGSQTSVYVGSFSKDYSELLAADQEDLPLYFGVGTGTAILSNRISWFFDLKGPSISLDTACSSALVALHLGCQSLRTGESTMSIVGGVNFMIVPGVMTAMSALHFLSPDSICHSFDEAANGYSRGEGSSFVVLKPLDQALRDGDVIRGVIRATGVNQDGNTPGITVPSASSQEALIRKCYRDAGLDFADTSFVEAHGTGTQAGDPQEASALAATFGASRPPGDPVWIGSVKSNIGHLEGASGLAQVSKAIFALEKGMVPATIHYKTPNARIPMDDWNLKVVDQLSPWPTAGQRRISINNFGYGGTNAHAIIDDAYHYLTSRGLKGNHNTEAPQLRLSRSSSEDSALGLDDEDNVEWQTPRDWTSTMQHLASHRRNPTKLLVWSSNEQSGVQRTSEMYQKYISEKLEDTLETKQDELLDKFARTLGLRRALQPWRSFAVVSSPKEAAEALSAPPNKPKRAKKGGKIAFIFTGQGAQWFAMGRELLAYKTFKDSLEEADECLTTAGAHWSLLEELVKPEADSHINQPEFAQPICTALQVALVDLLAEWGVEPAAVAGHSSGEISAAYTAGAISREHAWQIAYHRGRLAAALPELAPTLQGGMLATGLGVEALQPYLEGLTAGKCQVACKNSPSSTTISGDRSAIVELEHALKADNVFARQLIVTTAYHSLHMQSISSAYLRAISSCKPQKKLKKGCLMFSSVTGNVVAKASEISPEYWVSNMVNPVDFLGAIQSMVRYSKTSRKAAKPFVDAFLELGPSAALKGPLKQILKEEGSKTAELTYSAMLERGKDACTTALTAAGELFQQGYPLKFAAINKDEAAPGQNGHLVDIPPFAWNRNNKYWAESQVSKNYRFRQHPRTDLLGATIPQMNTMEGLFRNVMKVAEIPWVECHQVQGTILYPAAGMLVMAVEAAARLADRTREIEGYEVMDAIIGKAIVIKPDDIGTETQINVRPWRQASRDLEATWDEFRIFSRKESEWELNCSGLVRTKYKTSQNDVFANEEKAIAENLRTRFQKIEDGCYRTVEASAHYDKLAAVGLGFSGPFKSICSVNRGDFKSRCDISIPDTKAMMPHQYEFDHVIHPSTLDCIIQVGLAGATPANKELMVPLIPTSIGRLFVSADVSSKAGDLLHGAAAIENEGFDNAQGSFIVFDEEWKKPVVTIENVCSTALRHGELGLQQAAQIRKLATYLEWKEDIDKSTKTQLLESCAAARNGDLPAITKEAITELEHAAFIYMRRLLAECSAQESKTFAPHFQKLYQLCKKTFYEVIEGTNPHQARGRSWLSYSPTEEEELLVRVAAGSADGASLCQHGKYLPAMMRDEVKGIEVLMQDDLLNNFYQFGMGNAQVYAQLAAYVDLLGHKKPDMKILEIGAGTGGATLPVLQTLAPRGTSSPRFAEYTFTDISTGFFEKAHQKFKPWLPHMKFAKFDVLQDAAEQGIKLGDYDLIVAANVLHATPFMAETMASVRKLLKPDGKLVMSEITNPLLRIHMIVGCFSGWWDGAADGREWGPTMTEPVWDQVLKNTGFTGLDVVLRDLDDEEDHFYTLLVSSASAPAPTALPTAVTVIKPDETTDGAFWPELEQALVGENTSVNVISLDQAKEADLTSTPVVFAIDCEQTALLPDISQEHFEAIRKVIFTAPYSVYLTRGAALNSEAPNANMIAGLARCIRAENPTVSLTTLDFDGAQPLISASNVALAVKTIATAAQSIDAARPDWELAARDGKILVPRILIDDGVNELLSSTLIEPKPEEAAFVQEERSLELKVGTPGRLDTLYFVDDEGRSAPIEDSQVEIQVQAVGLNFKDIMISMGQIQEHALGLDCSGIVSRVGPNVTRVKPGDRVLTWGPGTFRNYFRTPSAMAFPIPSSFDFVEAASIPLAYSTAYYAIFESARLQKGETILIHGGAGAVGQAAIILAHYAGAEVFATVSSESKKQLLVDRLGVARDHIFNSRDLSFADGIMRMTNKRGVDVVLNSLAGEALQKTWSCVSYFGRFVEMGMKDIEQNTRLDMAPFARNVTFSSINLTTVLKHDTKKSASVLANVLDLVQKGVVKPIEPITKLGFSQIEEGFRTMQMGKHTGKIVFEVGRNDLVLARPPPVESVKFDGNSTYLLAGGLGGLGRSIAQWMVRGGARHFVFLSRSGAQKAEAQTTIQTLQDDGAHVAAFACDIADEESLRQALEQCKQDFPPIRGLLQCAMVLNDALYENMTHEEYLRATRPKVQGTWNLHNLLPQDLDFFVLLSSSAGVAGSRGQGNYAAGNTFEDALANYRNTHGQHATSIDLGMILDVGYVAETSNQEVAENTKKWSFAGIREDELHLIIQCAITRTSVKGRKVPAQLITGLGTGGMAKLAGYEIPWWFSDAKFAHIKNVDTSKVQTDSAEDSEETLALLPQATTIDNAADIVQIALTKKLAKSLMVEVDDVDCAKPISRHGVDSLLAVEIRAWLVTDLKADISVFQLLSNVPISELVKDIALKSKLVPASVTGATA